MSDYLLLLLSRVMYFHETLYERIFEGYCILMLMFSMVIHLCFIFPSPG